MIINISSGFSVPGRASMTGQSQLVDSERPSDMWISENKAMPNKKCRTQEAVLAVYTECDLWWEHNLQSVTRQVSAPLYCLVRWGDWYPAEGLWRRRLAFWRRTLRNKTRGRSDSIVAVIATHRREETLNEISWPSRLAFMHWIGTLLT